MRRSVVNGTAHTTARAVYRVPSAVRTVTPVAVDSMALTVWLRRTGCCSCAAIASGMFWLPPLACSITGLTDFCAAVNADTYAIISAEMSLAFSP